MSERGTGRESDKFMLRFPDGMREEIRRRAEANKRSMNAEIIARLEESLHADADIVTRAIKIPAPPNADGAPYLTQDDLAEVIELLNRRVAERAAAKKGEK